MVRFTPGMRALCGAAVLFAGIAAYLAPRLPARMASHFNSTGTPDGWSTPGTNITVLGIAALACVLVFGALWLGVRQIPLDTMRLPDKPEFRERAGREALRDLLADGMLWMAAGSVVWMAGILHSLYLSNQPGAYGLSPLFWLYTLGYAVFMVVVPLLPLAPLFPSDPEA